jgi:hypothetical protein
MSRTPGFPRHTVHHLGIGGCPDCSAYATRVGFAAMGISPPAPRPVASPRRARPLPAPSLPPTVPEQRIREHAEDRHRGQLYSDCPSCVESVQGDPTVILAAHQSGEHQGVNVAGCDLCEDVAPMAPSLEAERSPGYRRGSISSVVSGEDDARTARVELLHLGKLMEGATLYAVWEVKRLPDLHDDDGSGVVAVVAPARPWSLLVEYAAHPGELREVLMPTFEGALLQALSEAGQELALWAAQVPE